MTLGFANPRVHIDMESPFEMTMKGNKFYGCPSILLNPEDIEKPHNEEAVLSPPCNLFSGFIPPSGSHIVVYNGP